MSSLFKGFRDFIMRGNVVDLAVGIVIGAAFTGLVNQFTASFLDPLIHRYLSPSTLGGSGISLGHKQFLDYAAFINAVITFLLVAAVLYFLVVMPMNKLAERRKRGQVEEPAAPAQDILLLTEIRDALRERNSAGPGTPA